MTPQFDERPFPADEVADYRRRQDSPCARNNRQLVRKCCHRIGLYVLISMFALAALLTGHTALPIQDGILFKFKEMKEHTK